MNLSVSQFFIIVTSISMFLFSIKFILGIWCLKIVWFAFEFLQEISLHSYFIKWFFNAVSSSNIISMSICRGFNNGKLKLPTLLLKQISAVIEMQYLFSIIFQLTFCPTGHSHRELLTTDNSWLHRMHLKKNNMAYWINHLQSSFFPKVLLELQFT